jgi:hypothetical protein
VEAATSRELPQRTFYDRTVRVIDLFERLNQRQRMAPPRLNGTASGPWAGAN